MSVEEEKVSTFLRTFVYGKFSNFFRAFLKQCGARAGDVKSRIIPFAGASKNIISEPEPNHFALLDLEPHQNDVAPLH
jgi:hypothetical protein